MKNLGFDEMIEIKEKINYLGILFIFIVGVLKIFVGIVLMRFGF